MAESHYLHQMKSITTFVFDVDGVFTNGPLIITENGDLLRTMNIRDGYAVQLAVKKGYKVCIISGGRSEGVIARMKRLGVDNVFMGVENKTEKLKEFAAAQEISLNDVLYMGDDMPDWQVMKTTGFPCCPADAVEEIIALCKYISPAKGGEGCVRDVIEKVLKLNGDWE
jgi:3-deoxy-D-manno-octulosonate 8-phosphate phosphatase (KDO 8-P phosphatase)